ncbi:beta-galactosidase [Cohnella zeiphila]|uniref:Beta-galactosidase n=1 Tax=Cohnella zeiphila TaxID=2761120 RepID=A0A7X0SNC0_9BACL|nr:beta-galactosidase [Cohnella zeiphila]
MPHAIEWNAQHYVIDGKPGFLVSGEFHYFRVPRHDWEERLSRFREAGGNCVATYIPWILHEPAEGDIRFGDAPERDLESFLALCRDQGLFVIARPGPYQYSEMKYCGLPGWLCESYPELLARDLGGRPMVQDSVSYLHPLFLAKAKRWYDEVCPILARWTTSRGGPVAFVQFDNELTGIHEWFGGWDYHPNTMGFGREDGRYPRFLMRRYPDIRALNAAYGTDYARFADVRPADPSSPRNVCDRRRIKDYQDFYFGTVAEYARTLASWMRDAGIDCDLVHNSANPGSNAYHAETVAALGNRFLLGSDHYYNLDLDWNANNPTPKYALNALLSLESLRHMGFPPTVFELPGGSAADWPPITASDLKCCYRTNLAFGMKGLNYYVFTGGYNPDGIGGDGEIYDYQASIAPDNAVRPHYAVLKEFGLFLQENEWLAKAERIGDFRLGLDRELPRSKYYAAGDSGFGSADAWTFLHKGLAITSLCASYSPGTADLSSDGLLRLTDQPLFVASSDNMAASVQRRLVRFVEQGGRLLLAPVLPVMDEHYQPCRILADFLEGASIERLTDAYPDVRVGPAGRVHVNGGLWAASKMPSGAAAIAREETSGRTVAWKKTYEGGGCVLWLGLQWKFAKLAQLRMLEHVLQELGCPPPAVRCDNPNVWTSLRSDGDRAMLFAMNLFSSPLEAGLRVRGSDGAYVDLGRHALGPMEVKTIPIRERGLSR